MGPMMGLVGWAGWFAKISFIQVLHKEACLQGEYTRRMQLAGVSIKAGYWWYTATYKASYRCLLRVYL